MEVNTATGTIRMSEDEYADLSENDGGACLACGEEASGVEPDAHEYKCAACGARYVYGFEELMMMGAIEFT